MNDQKSSLQDVNANWAPILQKHPFLEGLQDRPQDKDEEVQKLRQWVKTQAHLPPLSDEHLLLFLHSNYYNFENTKETLDAYFLLRTTSPELFNNKSPSSKVVQNIWNLSNMVTFPKTTPEGYKVLLYRLTDYDASKLTFVDAMKVFFLFNDIRLSEDGLSPGYIVVFDMKGVTLSHLARINLCAVRKFMHYIQEGHPARLKGVHVINSVSFMDKVLALVRPLMKSGLIKLLTIHGSDLTALYQHIPKEIFPTEYGGQAESVQTLHDAHRKLVEGKYEKWVAEEELFVMDVTKRPKHARKPGFITSLKTLSID